MRNKINLIKINTRDWREVHATYYYTLAILKYVEHAGPVPEERKLRLNQVKVRVLEFIKNYDSATFFKDNEGKTLQSGDVNDYSSDYKMIRAYLEATLNSGALDE